MTHNIGSYIIFNSDSEEPFHKTAAFHESVQFIESCGRYLFLTGRWGSGKTTVAKRVYKSVTGKTPVIVKDLLEFDVNKHHQPVIFDEAIAEHISDLEKDFLKDKINRWCERMSSLSEKSFIIFTLSDEKFIDLLSLCENRKVINLSDSLTKGDRTQILHAHFNYFCPNQDFSKIEEIASRCNETLLGFPETCALFCRIKAHQEINGPLLFCNRPFQHLKSFLQTMYSHDRDNFLLLVYISLNEMGLDIKASNKDLLKLLNSHDPCMHSKKDREKENTIETGDTSKIELLETSASNSVGRDRSDALIRPLLPLEFPDKVQDTNKYRLQHDVVKRMTLIVYGTYHFDKLLEYAKPKDLAGWIEKSPSPISLFFMASERVNDIKPILKINKKDWEKYELKMGKAISSGNCKG